MSSPPSLRDMYSDTSSAWSFAPPPAPQGIPPSPNPPTIPGPGPSSAPYQWSTRPSHNSIFDLSPSLDLNDASTIHPSLLLRALVASAVLQYTSSAIAMPWEVGKLLLQVQWVPRDAGEPEPEPEHAEVEEDALSDASPDDDESYFADPSNESAIADQIVQPKEDEVHVRRSILEEGSRPEYIIPVGSADGVWGMIKRIGGFRSEGWLSLWKGLLTSCITEVISSTLQPVVHNTLQAIIFPSAAPFHHPPLILPVVSHLITGFVLSPLDLVRTRLIVQSFSPKYRSYSGPIDALRQIRRDEGGVKAMYLHPNLLIPTLIDNTLRPLVSLALPAVLATRLGAQITEEGNPVAWGLAELAGSCLGLLITLPFETIRRRLQVQTRGRAKPLNGCVELRPAPYNGVVDTFWHILTEERSDLPIIRTTAKRRRRTSKGKEEEKVVEAGAEETWAQRTGVGQLYRGMGMRLGASVIVFILALLSGEDKDGGWAEL